MFLPSFSYLQEQASIHEELRALRKALNEHARLLDGLDDRKIDRSELHKAINKLMEVLFG